MARKSRAPADRSGSLARLARGTLLLVLAAALGVIGFQALRFVRTCATIDGAREAIEAHVRSRQVRRMARVLKTADPEVLAAGTTVRVSALTCGPSLLGGVTCRARYTVNGHKVGLDAVDHYFRIGYSLRAGWRVASVTETSDLRYSLAPCRCSLGIDGR